jgi:hypothetical protein
VPARASRAFYCLSQPRTDRERSNAEYFHAGWGYYFVTAFPAEISALDGGAFGGVWQRTGQTFPVWASQDAGTSPVCRFFSTSFAPRSSHFYTPFPAECETVKSNSRLAIRGDLLSPQDTGRQRHLPSGVGAPLPAVQQRLRRRPQSSLCDEPDDGRPGARKAGSRKAMVLMGPLHARRRPAE